MLRFVGSVLVAVVVLCGGSFALAQTPDDLLELELAQLMQLEVNIATGTGKTLSKAPAVVTLITAEAMRTNGHEPYIKSDRSKNSGNAQLGYKNLDLRAGLIGKTWRLLTDYTRKEDQEIGFVGGGSMTKRGPPTIVSMPRSCTTIRAFPPTGV